VLLQSLDESVAGGQGREELATLREHRDKMAEQLTTSKDKLNVSEVRIRYSIVNTVHSIATCV